VKRDTTRHLSREGSSANLLPSSRETVQYQVGDVSHRSHLFVAAGAFHVSKPSTYSRTAGPIPISRRLEPLGREISSAFSPEPLMRLDLRHMPRLLGTEGVRSGSSIRRPSSASRSSCDRHERTEKHWRAPSPHGHGALLDEISFDAPEMGGSR